MAQIFRYSAFSLAIESCIELPELPSCDEEPDVVIRLGSVPAIGRKATADEEFGFNLPHGGRFHILKGSQIIVEPATGADPTALQSMLMGKAMGYLLRQRGWLPLHSSGVAIEDKGVLFLGASGAGKSTTAAAFHASGHTVITDEIGAIRVEGERAVVRPAWARIRLLEDALSVLKEPAPAAGFHRAKYTLDLRKGVNPATLPLKRIYVLEDGEELRSEVIQPLSAVPILSSHSFISRRGLGPEALQVHLRHCVSIVLHTIVSRLIRPRALRDLPDLVRLVEAEVDA
jgi:hypothetical protein